MTKKSVAAIAVCCMLLLFSESVYAAEGAMKAFHDDFNYYNAQTMQKASWSNGGAFDCIFSPDNVTFSNGMMSLKLDNSSISGYKYAGAEYRTREDFGYGSYRVSMKAIKNDGVVSSFFTYTGPAMGKQWDEIDIEFLGKDTTKVQFNFFTNGVSMGGYLYKLGFDASQGFHEYGFDWSEDSIIWYVDGEAVYEVTSSQYELPSTPGRIMMNVWNGKTEYTKYWLNEYDGTTPLTARYKYIDYRPVVNSNQESTDDDVVEAQEGTVLPENWTTDETADQYTLESVYGLLRATRTEEQNEEYASFAGALSENVTNPTELNMKIKFLGGSKRVMTVYLVDTENQSTKVLEIDYPRTDYEEHTIAVPLEGIEGEICRVEILLNSEPEKLDVENESRCKVYISDVTVSN